jgi:uncharacterized protein YbjT (DUF2867 family)
MKQPKILVTGATGRTGSAVVDELLAKDVPVRALVDSKDARSEALERKGAETVVADMFDLDQLLAAMRGTQRPYYLPFYHPYMIQSATAFAVAAQEAKLVTLTCEDIARVVVAVLMDPDKHAGKVYRPTGPALLSVRRPAGSPEKFHQLATHVC